jgi:anti-sigma B factor antagonist
MTGGVLEVHVSEYGGCTVCRPVGELDAFTVGGFRDHLAELGSEAGLVIDLSDVPFMDSAGLGALIGGIRRIRDGGGSVAVVCSRPAVLRLLHTTGFDRIVGVSATLDEAVAGLSTPNEA